ncbi:hypothetical protein JOM56_009683 [Amanita muscaria]
MSTAKLKLKFYQIDVFTRTPYEGNPLAIVHLPPKQDIPLVDKQRIAREFNLSETVFLHENDENGGEIKIDIFTPTVELPFAGHPTIGVGWHLLAHLQRDTTAATLLTKAGSVPVVQVSGTAIDKVKLEVPIDFRVHAPHADPAIMKDQARLTADDYVNGTDEPHVVASVVKGMTFVLLQLKTTDALGRFGPYAQRRMIPSLGDWGGFVGVYAFVILGEEAGNGEVNGVIRVQTRMFDGTLEDPATGSAACTLAGWLSLARGKGKWAVDIVQGVEMGKKSEIGVVVEVGDNEKIERIELAGSAVQVMEGHLYL